MGGLLYRANMTTQDITPSILANIRDGAEPVIVDTEAGWRMGVRGKGCYVLGNALGRMTVTEDDQVFHSMLGSRPTFSRREALDEVAYLESRAHEMMQLLNRLP